MLVQNLDNQISEYSRYTFANYMHILSKSARKDEIQITPTTVTFNDYII